MTVIGENEKIDIVVKQAIEKEKGRMSVIIFIELFQFNRGR